MLQNLVNPSKLLRVGYRLPAYGELESPKFGSSPKFTGSPKFSQETITCDSDGKTGQDDYIKGWYNLVQSDSNFSRLIKVRMAYIQ